MRVLCIEDDSTVAAIVTSALRQAGLAVDHTAAAEDGLAAMAAVAYDAVVLDLTLPDGDGIAVLHKLRRAKNSVPILILSGRSKAAERTAGLDAGGDDYLPKPFDVPELVARVRALLRRPAAMAGMDLRCGNLVFYPQTHVAVVDGVEHPLRRREATLLEQLLRSAGRPVPKSLIEDRMYAFGEELASNAIEVHVHHLRRRLASFGAEVQIETVRNTGYVLRASGSASDSGRRATRA